MSRMMWSSTSSPSTGRKVTHRTGSPFGLQMITVARRDRVIVSLRGEFGAQRLDERVAVGGLIRPVEVDVDYQPATGWSILRDRGDIVESRTESVEFGHRRDQMQPVGP